MTPPAAAASHAPAETADEKDALREQILALVGRYAEIAHATPEFRPGASAVPVSGKVYGAREMQTLVDSALDFWLTTGRFNAAFEKALEKFIGVRHALTANSGSSANLLALTALTSPLLKERALQPGDEVITVAAGFPTTLNPILQNGMTPVFVDVDIPTYNIRADLIEAAISPRTRAIMIAHTLGNPFDLAEVTRIAEKYGLWLVEDCCDALGSLYDGRQVGTFGDIGTLSFYPAHHITMGEGGAVFTSRSVLRRSVESFRDWGRDCWCAPGKDDTCKKRYEWQSGDLPFGYDHKYVYQHLGYNLKITDMQAAVALAQMERLPGFIEARKRNFALLKEALRPYEDVFLLPEATPRSDPSWFGFALTLRENAPFGREALLQHLAERRIGSRLLFGGNLLRQPYMKDRPHRVAGALSATDVIMRRTFWVGVYPGLSEAHIAYIAESIGAFLADAGHWRAA
ncbi:CDP-6-deoxy-D-xylo-4-hexulose-3-dehydrase [Methylosinus sp. sav-2]|uniref:lipopolysaccharide biosynthesis protein RfbH n=1 Tax=unclassified Methylosinus TaxID=2624500 RepID=UPI000465A0FD|nr:MULTISPECIES: lipopolysaccharide biosynthesis protein RfbH [unclassified Methylosinus]TDX65771.1 CDP-6-deoxy-D-xylo-4-hexulose-3-dehydrase [Methylosinus sp. sav-2]